MKKFSFNLESLLVLREWEQRKAQQKLADATVELNGITEKLEYLDKERESTFGNWEADTSHGFSAHRRVEFGARMLEIEKISREANELFRSALEQREAAVGILKSASRDLKVVENLREKRLEEHRAETVRQETAEMEDVFNARRKVEVRS